jgi:uncharacterized protein YndB with AHSA1/START domain
MADILHSIQISAPADAIYPLISTAQGLAQWWASDVTETGGAVELGFFNRQTVYRLRAQINQPPSRFEWACETGKEWAGTRLIFKLEPAGKRTLVRFTHAGWQSATDYFASCTTTWGELMFRLKAAAEEKSRGPLFLASSLTY